MGSAVPVSAKEFFEALWSVAPEGFIELSLIRPNANHGKADDAQPWFYSWPSKLDEFLAKAAAERGAWNVYFGVGTRSRMRGKDVDVAAIPALHCDIDFKKTPRDAAIKKLREFPIRASVGNLTGGGLHVFWLLKEAATGDDLQKVRTINRAIATALDGDLRACTLKQILRVPGSTNIKYAHKPEVEIAVWRPELRYSLNDFDILPQEEAKPAAATNGSSNHAVPSRDIPPELANRITKLMAEIWVKGYRHSLALYLSGVLAHAGYSQEAALQVIRSVCALAQDEEAASRETSVGSTYEQFLANGPVAGAPSIEKLIEKEFPVPFQEKAKKVFDMVRKTIPKTSKPKSEAEPDFEILKIVKFDSRPAIWEITLKHASGRELVVKAETRMGFHLYRDFHWVCLEQCNVMLADISQPRWQKMVSKALDTLEIKEAPKEARMDGAVEEVLNQFVAERKANPQVGELKSFPGYDDQGMFFKLGTFKSFLRNDGVRPTERDLCQTLRNLGWEPESRRIGESTVRLWKKVSANGNGHKPPDLFQTPLEPQKPSGITV